MRNKDSKFKRRSHEAATFLKRFFTHPGRIGSVAPSSKFLAHAILSQVDWANAKNIAELGAGTGVFTRDIVKLARSDANILVFEIDVSLRRLIKEEHPEHKGLKLYSDAQKLEEAMRENKIEKFDYIISSLPFTVLPHNMSENILNAVNKTLSAKGRFIAYQYSRIMAHTLQEKFSDVKSQYVLLNIPPAFVFNCARGASCTGSY